MQFICLHPNATDIDECGTNNYTCPEAANCSNTNGSYECVCWTGYHEILNPNEDRFSCSGIRGYIVYMQQWTHDMFGNTLLKQVFFNIDINECESSDNTCHEHAQCTNSNGSFSCECMEGYTGDGHSNCTGKLCRERKKK